MPKPQHDHSGRPYLAPYRQGYEQYGSEFEVTLWASRQTQALRFEIFAELCDMRGLRVLDAGCSRGDLAVWLIKHLVSFQQYIGLDALEPVIDYARQLRLPHCEFHAGDFVSQPDLLKTGQPQVICISGSLNTMSDQQAQAVLQAAWNATEQTLIFNFLSDKAGPLAPLQDSFARRLNTMAILDWAFSQTHDVIFRQDYFPNGHDATIRMVRG